MASTHVMSLLIITSKVLSYVIIIIIIIVITPKIWLTEIRFYAMTTWLHAMTTFIYKLIYFLYALSQNCLISEFVCTIMFNGMQHLSMWIKDVDDVFITVLWHYPIDAGMPMLPYG